MHNVGMQMQNRIKEYRILCQLDQAELGKILHVSRQSISRWENSRSHKDPKKFSFPTKDNYQKLLAFFSEKLKKDLEMSDLFYSKNI